MHNSIWEKSLINFKDKEDLNTALDEMEVYVQKLESKEATPNDIIENWKKFIKYIKEDLDLVGSISKYAINTIPHIISMIGEMKTRDEIKSGNLNMKSATKRASGWDAHSFMCSRLIDISVQLGADLNSKVTGIPFKSIGMPAAHYATFVNNYNCLSTLIKNGADVNIPCYYGMYPIHYAFTNEKGFKVTVITPNKDVLTEYLKINSQNIRKLVIDKTNDVNIPTKRGNTALYFATSTKFANDIKLTKALLLKGANPDKQNKYGNTPLHKAATLGNQEQIILLKQYNANLDIQNTDGKTPIHLAAMNNDRITMDLLISLGCNQEIKDNSDRMAIEYLKDIKQNKKVDTKEQVTEIKSRTLDKLLKSSTKEYMRN